MTDNVLNTPVKLGHHTLNNRIVLPPLTRQRSAQPGDIATDLMAEYYRQRSLRLARLSDGYVRFHLRLQPTTLVLAQAGFPGLGQHPCVQKQQSLQPKLYSRGR